MACLVLAGFSFVPLPNPGVVADSYFVDAANQHILADPPRNLLYWGDGSGGRVWFLDGTTGEALDNVTVGGEPLSLSLTPDGSELLVAVAGAGRIVALDPDTREELWQVEVPFEPLSVRMGRPDRLYLTSRSDTDLRVVNATTGSVVQTVPGVFHEVLEVDATGTRLLALTLGSSPVKLTLYRIEADGTLTAVAWDDHDLGSYLQDQVPDWDRGVLYMVSGAPYGIEMVSLNTLDRLGLWAMDAYPQAVDLSPDRTVVYGLHSNYYDDTALWAFNTESGIGLGRAELDPGASLVAAAPDGEGVFLGEPLVRLTLHPSVAPAYPTPDAELTLDSFEGYLEAKVWRGIPTREFLSAEVRLNGVPQDARLHGDFLRVYLPDPLDEGVHLVWVSVSWSEGMAEAVWEFALVPGSGDPDPEDPAVEVLPLKTFAHPTAGFSIDLPDGWDVETDYEIPDWGRADVVAFGPYEGSFQTTLVVFSEEALVLEGDAHLLAAADATIQEIGKEEFVEVVRPPRVVATENARAALFELRYPDYGTAQVVGITANRSHGRVWVVAGTVQDPMVDHYRSTFEAVVASFQVQEAVATTSPWHTATLVLIPASLVAVGGAVVWVAYRRRGGLPGPESTGSDAVATTPSPHPVSPLPDPSVEAPRFCVQCGGRLLPPHRHCPQCGAAARPGWRPETIP